MNSSRKNSEDDRGRKNKGIDIVMIDINCQRARYACKHGVNVEARREREVGREKGKSKGWRDS